MSELYLRKSKSAFKHYDLSDHENRLTVLDAGSESHSSFVLGDIDYRMEREKNWGDFVLFGPEDEICRAGKPSAMFRSFEMEYAGQQWTLQAASVIGDSFELRTGGEVVGGIDAKGIFIRRGEAHLPDQLPMPVQCFLIWLALLMWVRSDDVPSTYIPVG